MTVKQGSQEGLKSYVQRFKAESLKIDIPDEKFAITTFIAGLGVQSKDLMFSISKNPQASMAEVLAKAETKPSYPRRRALPPIKRKVGQINDEDEALKGKAFGRHPQRKMENDPQKGVETSGIVWVHRSSKDDDAICLSGSLP